MRWFKMLAERRIKRREREGMCENYNTVYCLCALGKLPHPFLVHKDTNLISDLGPYSQSILSYR